MVEDFVGALRQLWRHRGHTGIVVLILSLGLGVNSAVFSVVDAALFRALPVEEPSRLVLFQWTSGPGPALGHLSGEWWQEAATGRVTASSFSHPAFVAFGERATTLDAVFGWAELRQGSLAVDGESDLVAGQLVSGGYYDGLGVPAHLGRAITPADDRTGAELVAVLSHGYWRRRFGGDPHIIGRRGTLEGRPLTIVGVSVRGFAGTLPMGRSADVSVPVLAWRAPGEPYLSNPSWHWLQVMGRLERGVTLTQAEAEMAPRLAAAVPAGGGQPPDLRLVDGRQGLVRKRDEHRPALLSLAAVGALLLLMACSAVAGVTLSRGIARRREIGIRLALGAGRRRVVRQLLAESLIQATLAGVAGVALALSTKDALAAGLMRDAPAVPLDGRVMAVAGLASAVTAILSGLAPALRATRLDLTRELKSGGDGAGGPLGTAGALVVAQVAAAVALLVGAGLFLRTARNLVTVDTGMATRGLHLFKVHVAGGGSDLSRRLLESYEALPGVRAVGVSAHQLLGDSTTRARVRIEGRGADAAGEEFARVNRVGGDFFEAAGIAIRSGRALGPEDGAAAPPVVVVNEAFVRAFFGGQDPRGRRLNGAEVVGVAADTPYGALRETAPPTMFVPALQQAQGAFCFQVRTAAPRATLEPRLRQATQDVALGAVVYDLTTPRQRIEREARQERVLARFTSAFGALALTVASLGLYGLMAYSMRRRTREVGVRMALGARPADIRRMALASGVRVVVVGAALGLTGAFPLTRLASGVLYGVTPSDPLTSAAAVALVAVVTTLACWLPAARAARLDPAVALRCE